MVNDFITKPRRPIGKAIARHKQFFKRFPQVNALFNNQVPRDLQAQGRERLIVNETTGRGAKLSNKARPDVRQRYVVFRHHVLDELLLLGRKVDIDIRVAIVAQICVHVAQVVAANRLRVYAVLVRVALGKLLARQLGARVAQYIEHLTLAIRHAQAYHGGHNRPQTVHRIRAHVRADYLVELLVITHVV